MLYSKINSIIISINVFKDVFVNFDVYTHFHVDINVIFDRKIKIIKNHSTILFEFIF